MRPSSRAWITLGAGVVLYDVLAPQGETLSERVDDAIENHPIATILAVGAVALHLINAIPPNADPIHLLAERIRWKD